MVTVTLSKLGVPYLLDEESTVAPPAEPEGDVDARDGPPQAAEPEPEDACVAVPPTFNGDLYFLLEQAARNATGRDDTDVAMYVAILKDEWITDVEALGRLDPEALDELLPLLLSQEVQRLVRDEGHKNALACNRHGRWRRSTHKRGGVLGGRRKDMDAIPEMAPVGDDSTASSSSIKLFERTTATTSADPAAPQKLKPYADEDKKYVRSSIKYARRRQTKPNQIFCRLFDLFEHFCSSNFKDYDEANDLKNDGPTEEGVDDDELQKISNEAPFMADANERAYHLIADATRKADIVANAQRQFPTREALEDAILECEARVARGGNDAGEGPSIGEGGNLVLSAEDELRGLYPLRLVLPTVADLTEMIGALQVRREKAMRDLDIKKAEGLGRDLEELQTQRMEEERYMVRKRMGETKCMACGERFTPPLASTRRMGAARERHCEQCREVFGSEERRP